MIEILKRLKEPTPSFWKRIQKIGMTLGIIGGAIVAAPVSLPASIVTIAGYLITTGAVTTGLSQLTSTER